MIRPRIFRNPYRLAPCANRLAHSYEFRHSFNLSCLRHSNLLITFAGFISFNFGVRILIPPWIVAEAGRIERDNNG